MIVNEAECLERVGNDLDLLRELLTMFATEKTNGLGKIARAIAARDANALHIEAHKLKGGALCFGAQDTVAAAYALETLGKKIHKGEADWTEVAELHARVLVELDRLQPELDRMARG